LSSDDLTEKVAKKVEKAFAEIHKLEVIHGDVRASNILVAEDESIWILDFESAQVVSGSRGQVFIDGEALEVKMLLDRIRRNEPYC